MPVEMSDDLRLFAIAMAPFAIVLVLMLLTPVVWRASTPEKKAARGAAMTTYGLLATVFFVLGAGAYGLWFLGYIEDEVTFGAAMGIGGGVTGAICAAWATVAGARRNRGE